MTCHRFGGILITSKERNAIQAVVVKMTRLNEIARDLRNSGEWIPELCEELCDLAGMSAEYKEADGETFESVVYAAAEKLGIEV